MNELESTTCKRCGRRLKTEASIKLGMGETCFKKYQKENNHKPLFKEVKHDTSTLQEL